MNHSLLDLFCGMGGWSIGFYREGFNCTGVDIIDVGYPYTLIKQDIKSYNFTAGNKPDVITASPPCTEFSPMTKLSAYLKERAPPDPEGPNGLGLVKEAIRVIKEVNPRFWLLENVFGSRKYIEPLLGKPRVEARPYILWGNFPDILWPDNTSRNKNTSSVFSSEAIAVAKKNRGILPQDFPFDPLRSWKRSKIPIWVSQTVAKACAEWLLAETVSK
jgi:hypothetical protein